MEVMTNGSVEDYMIKQINSGGVSLDLRMRWCRQMAEALAYLHNRRPKFLIHRYGLLLSMKILKYI